MDSITTSNPPAPTDEPPAAPSATPSSSATPERGAPRLRWFDVLIFAVLVIGSSIGFYGHARGDLYSDEADYALASTRGFDANRWDRSNDPREPNRLIAGRHFHAPGTVYLVAAAHRFGAADRTIRMPFIVAGGLSVGLVYLCGLALYDRRREAAVACALLVAISPPVVRMASHALPWSAIILETLMVLWCMAEYTRDRRWGWIAGCFAALACMFVTSEMFFVVAPAVVLAAPIALWKERRLPGGLKRIAGGCGVGTALFVSIVMVAWPIGLEGDAVKMLRHYMEMRHSDSFPVNVGQQIFAVAPKWAYLYWYWNDYKPFTVCYAVGIPALVALAASRKLHPSLAPLLSIAGFVLFAAHRAHIIGPEYFAHCLPLLTLVGGYAVYAVGLAWRPLGLAAILLLAAPAARWSPRVGLPGMDARAQVSRWPAAAHFLAQRWNPGDKIVVGSQPVSVAHWYLVYQAGVPPSDSQFQTMPVHQPKPSFLERLSSGFYRYVAVSNMFEDSVDLDPKTRRILRDWPVIWRSDEHGTGPSRLSVYERPATVGTAGSTGPVSSPKR